MDGRYLLVRSVDHVVLGVQFTQMELVAPGGLSPPSLRAAGPTSSLVLTFPPQHITEQVIGPGLSADSGVFDEPFDPLGCRLAGISRVAFEVSIGTPIPLTVEGILSAVDAGLVLPGRPADPAIPGDTAGPTAIEMPWLLVMSPEPRSGRGFVTTSHSAGPLELDTGSFGLWLTSLRASDATGAPPLRARARTRRTTRPDAGLALRPIDRGTADLPDPSAFEIPLQRFARNLIVNAGADAPAPTERLDLSSLGGNLTVRADWTNLRWQHDATPARSVPLAEGEIMESAVSLAEPVVISLKQEAPETSELLALRKAKEV